MHAITEADLPFALTMHGDTFTTDLRVVELVWVSDEDETLCVRLENGDLFEGPFSFFGV
jgi:hypothetical protein